MHAFVLTPCSARHTLHSYRSAALGRPLASRVVAASHRRAIIVSPNHFHIKCQEKEADASPSTEEQKEQDTIEPSPVESQPDQQEAQDVQPEITASVEDPAVAIEEPPTPVATESVQDTDDNKDKRQRRRRTREKREITLPLEDLKEGMELEGVVKGVMQYGAFVGGLGTPSDGLIHVSQLAQGYVENVSDVVSVGDKVKVRVLSVDLQKRTFALTLQTADEMEKQQQQQQQQQQQRDQSRTNFSRKSNSESRKIDLKKKWDAFTFNPEEFINVKVLTLTDFGAFCQILDDDKVRVDSSPTDGLVHISELSTERVESVSDVVSVGDFLRARILSADPERNRISMSLKPVPTAEELEQQKLARQNENRDPSNFSDKSSNRRSRNRKEPLDPDESPNVSADLKAAEAGQPEFKSTFQLAFEKANIPIPDAPIAEAPVSEAVAE